MFMRISHFLSLGFLFICVSCNNATPTASSAKKADKGPVNSKLSGAGTGKLMAVVTNYYGLKNALVASDAIKAGETSTQLQIAVDSMSVFLKGDTINKAAFQPYLDTVMMQSKTISGIQDLTCEKQRLAFSSLSAAIYTMLKNAELKNGGVYKQYCPMAFNDKGAFWLSDVSEIKNPYFGKKMLECGEVQDSL